VCTRTSSAGGSGSTSSATRRTSNSTRTRIGQRSVLMVTLRPYQEAAINDIRNAYVSGNRRVLFVLPTGGGKTVCFSYLAARIAAAGKRVWIIAHRDELLNQISGSLLKFGVEHDVMRGGSPIGWRAVQVCSVQTLVRRLSRV